jgi:cephalosporin-C deacetylase
MSFPHLRRFALAVASALAVAALTPPAARAQEIVAAPTQPTGVYAVGQTADWRVELKGAPAGVTALRYVVKKNGLTPLKEGTVDLTDGVGTVRASLNEPGALLVEFKLPAGTEAKPTGAKPTGAKPTGAKATSDGKAVRGLAGAVFAPEEIQPTVPLPTDFDAFWKAKLDELTAVPANPKVEPGDAEQPTDVKKPPVEYFKVTLDNVRGTKVYGQLAKPKKEGKFPALLLVQYAGVYGLPKSNVVSKAQIGYLTLNVMAHDLPLDQPKAFYDQQSAGPLKDYVGIGSDDRETSYFLRMCLGCYRAAEYLATRDDWDGRTLIVSGTSQGGYQAFVTAALHPKVTAMIANVPAGCDATGVGADGKPTGRAAGWPYWVPQAKGRDVNKVVATSRYFDAVSFARRVKVPALVSMGLIDESCPPAAVLGACNVLQGKVERVILPKSNHQGTGNAQAMMYARSDAWLRALAKGEEPPPPAVLSSATPKK